VGGGGSEERCSGDCEDDLGVCCFLPEEANPSVTTEGILRFLPEEANPSVTTEGILRS
jgi:hypothetical protein